MNKSGFLKELKRIKCKCGKTPDICSGSGQYPQSEQLLCISCPKCGRYVEVSDSPGSKDLYKKILDRWKHGESD